MGKMEINRRHLLVTAGVFGGGMVLGVTVPNDPLQAAFSNAAPWGDSNLNGAVEFTPWISIAPDDTVTVRVTTPEQGAGVMTQAAMTVTEELQCDWSKVRAEFAPTNRDYRENAVYSTPGGLLAWFSGRSTTEDRMKIQLQVGASARERLKAAAAAQWKVPVTQVEAKNSVLTHVPTGRTLRYGEMAAKAATIKLASEPAPKPQSEWTFLGKASPAKLNIPQIVDGSAVYGMDVKPEGMVYAALRQSPVQGGKLKSYDAAAVMKMPGVLAVVTVDPSEKRGGPDPKAAPFGLANTMPQAAVAVIAEHYWQARKALDALPVEWEDGAGAHWKTIDMIHQAAFDALEKPGEKIAKTVGDISLLDKQKTIVQASYHTPYCEHSPIEPLNGTAMVTPDRVEMWHPSQVSKQAFGIAADEAGLSPEKVVFNQTFIGGAFGRRIMGDDVRMVVAVAKKFPGRPVHVIWSREEMMRQGRYRPLIATKYRAGLDEQGMPAVFHARLASHGGGTNGLANAVYAGGSIPNLQVETHDLPVHIMTAPYRAPDYNSNCFSVESFIDECAAAAGIDPLAYRLKLLEKWPDPAWANMLKVLAEKANWGQTLPRGMGQGLAIGNWAGNGKPKAGTTVAALALVEISKAGKLNVRQIDIAFDTGRIVNRDAVLNELQGGVVFGLNMSLNEGITLQNGRVSEGNFDAYPMLRTGDIPPKINVHFEGLSGNDRFSEIGEPPVGVVGPAVANAIYRAIGKRIRSTPFRHHDLSWT